ncbi:helix-turn-helix domain-containing protein [Tessaracoccus massiliensis]|uniref:helix-turn-helix domain-containing protein n=1 Tax=Tessaracoccus massiliensis TaxID=1522311 RepID=UPI000694B8FF|nr:helix-turn-helix domain-containing protein [Tessaracoccus massiliensis]
MQLATMAQVAAAVRSARVELGWTQSQLAERLHASRDWVIRLEQGNPRLEVQRVLDALTVLGISLVGESGAVDELESAPFADVFQALS